MRTTLRGAACLACAAVASAVPVPASAHTAGRLVGTGTPGSCTSAAVVDAVAAGGAISFDCGPKPVTIVMTETAKVENTSPRVVIDGGNLITLSGGGARRILYMDTCDAAQHHTTSHCEQQKTPDLVIKNLALDDGVSAGDGETGGGALYAFGGRLTITHVTFAGDRCAPVSGADVGGGAVSALWQDVATPVVVADSTFSGDTCDNGGPGGGGGGIFATQNGLAITHSTFTDDRCPQDGPDVGGAAVRALIEHGTVGVSDSTFTDNACSNGAALSSIGASWAIRGSHFSGNEAIGTGANPAAPGTPGGGSGGAIYMDGDAMTLSLTDSTLDHNSANEGGGAIFFVSDNRTGTMSINRSSLIGNPNAGFQTPGLPGIFFLGARAPRIRHSVLKP